ncbi:maleate cis-trans isomerase [Saccharothrix sp. ALI-22-I]|uniref:maleate cis-trans isomerase family protein n=1 Tax=Saccharothrix sp. ALI-22-I TaxID=1933778 RepID=UPI00097BAC9D|nr:maleate cis-trans isomerase [Saccharothrix sp. ALI-22-I]ONI90725.1 maleate cis-trans isomerase [Saccharothrix sp. ALI-22-I]
MWQSDGWDVRARIGVLTPHADVGPESELRAMAPPDVGVHAARVEFGAMGAGGVMAPTIPLAPVLAFVEPPHIDDAVGLLSAAPVAAIGIGFTSSAYADARAEERAVDRLRALGGIPVVATCPAAVEALSVLGADRIAVFNPPWFDAALDQLGVEYFTDQGFDVIAHGSCVLPSNQRNITPLDLYDWLRAHTPDTAEAVFVGGNGFRTVGVIAALEQHLGRPVLTANQVLLWKLLRTAQVPTSSVRGYGWLFETS